jgi:hypothetical protein
MYDFRVLIKAQLLIVNMKREGINVRSQRKLTNGIKNPNRPAIKKTLE